MQEVCELFTTQRTTTAPTDASFVNPGSSAAAHPSEGLARESVSSRPNSYRQPSAEDFDEHSYHPKENIPAWGGQRQSEQDAADERRRQRKAKESGIRQVQV